MNNINITYKNKKYVYPKGSSLLEISKDFKKDFKQDIIMGEVNYRPCELNYIIQNDSYINFFDRTSAMGSRVYESGLIFILIEAFQNVLKSSIEVKYSIDKGIYIQTKKKITKESLKKVSDEMKSLVSKDLPINKNLINRYDAINYYKAIGDYDKVNVLKYSINTNVNLYRLNDTYDYFFSYLPISTGSLKDFELTYLDENGFILRYPNIYYMDTIPTYKHFEKLFNEFKKYDEWCLNIGINNVSELNNRVTKGNINDLILLSESIQNKRLFEIAEKIKNNKNIKIVLISGPSSSGKTTTSKKLELFLKGYGLSPISLSVDDYFVDRDKTPKLKDGTYDFESLRAVNVKKFNKDLRDLLDGQEVYPLKFNFVLGKSEISNKSIKLNNKQILIIEGLHALNEELTSLIERKNKFKIYLSPLTVLSLDDHNRIRTSDVRLLRRIVRDNYTRGYSASQTITNFKNVRKGEEMYVFPFQDEADVVFNTSLIYELGVLKTYVEPILFSIDENDENYIEAIRLLNLLKNVLPISNDFIPKDSILREFIGNGYFK